METGSGVESMVWSELGVVWRIGRGGGSGVMWRIGRGGGSGEVWRIRSGAESIGSVKSMVRRSQLAMNWEWCGVYGWVWRIGRGAEGQRQWEWGDNWRCGVN